MLGFPNYTPTRSECIMLCVGFAVAYKMQISESKCKLTLQNASYPLLLNSTRYTILSRQHLIVYVGLKS